MPSVAIYFYVNLSPACDKKIGQDIHKENDSQLHCFSQFKSKFISGIIRLLFCMKFFSNLRFPSIDIYPRGVLRYISDGDVQSPFLGLKFAIWGLFWGWNFVVTIFGWGILVRTFFGVDKKRNPGFSFLCQTIVSWRKNCLQFSWIIINYYFLIGLFWGYILGRWTFFGSGSSLKDFFRV